VRKLIANRFQPLMEMIASERRDQVFLAQLVASYRVELIGHVVNRHQRHRLRPGQSGPLPLGIERSFAPGRECVEALFSFATRPRGFGM
jgi:hypothetical protein